MNYNLERMEVMKKIFLIMLMLMLLVFASVEVSYAENFMNVPTKDDEILQGDTYDKGDGNIKVFDSDGKIIYSGSQTNWLKIIDINKSSGGSLGYYEGVTDIYWEYGIPLWGNSGPVVECVTASYDADGSDYLYVKNELYIEDDDAWYRLQYSSDTRFDAFEAEAYTDQLTYGFYGYVGSDWRGNGTHIIEDSDEGWDDTFSTSEII